LALTLIPTLAADSDPFVMQLSSGEPPKMAARFQQAICGDIYSFICLHRINNKGA